MSKSEGEFRGILLYEERYSISMPTGRGYLSFNIVFYYYRLIALQ